mgnify:CR=1 FL=1
MLSNPDDFLIYSLAVFQSPVVEGVKIVSQQGMLIVESGEDLVGVEKN